MSQRFVMLCGLCLSVLMSSLCSGGEIHWKRIKIDDTFRSEGVAAADINKDGKTDVIHEHFAIECKLYGAPSYSVLLAAAKKAEATRSPARSRSES